MSGSSEKDPKEVAAAAAAAAEAGKPDDSDVLMETEEERRVRIDKEEEGIKAALALIEASKDVAKFLTPDRAEKLSKQLGQRDDGQKDEEAKAKAKKEKERERWAANVKADKEKEEALARREAALNELEENWASLQKKRASPKGESTEGGDGEDRTVKKAKEDKKVEEEEEETDPLNLVTAGQKRSKFRAEPAKWNINMFLPACKLGRDQTFILPEDSVTAAALTMAPNTEGKFKIPMRFEKEAPKNVTRILAGRVTRERDSMTEETDEKTERNAREVTEASAVLIRFLEGCSDFPPLQQGVLDAVGRALVAKKTGALLPPHASDLIFPLLSLAFKRLACLRDRGGYLEQRITALEVKTQYTGWRSQAQKWPSAAQEYTAGQSMQPAGNTAQQQQQQQQQLQLSTQPSVTVVAAAAASGKNTAVCGICAAKNKYEVEVNNLPAADPATLRHPPNLCPNKGLPKCAGWKVLDEMFRARKKR